MMTIQHKKKTTINFIIVGFFLITSLFLLGCYDSNPAQELPENPFSIQVLPPEIVVDGQDNRLKVNVSMISEVEEYIKDVYFTVELNEEVKPFIAAQILKFTGDVKDVAPLEEVKKSKVPGLVVTGFEHTWEMLLTTSEDLKNYSQHSPEEIRNELKSITVTVYWKGGSQQLIQPVNLP